MSSKEEEMMEAVINMAEGNKKTIKGGAEAIVSNLFEHGMLPKDALGIGDKNVEKLYAEAYQLYNMGRYEEAMHAFSGLHMLDITESRYIFGLAACSHMLKHYEAAAENYMRCSLYDPTDPIPYYHAADCYIEVDDIVGALIALHMVLKRAGDKPEYSVMKDRAQMTIATLKKEGKGKKNERPEEAPSLEK